MNKKRVSDLNEAVWIPEGATVESDGSWSFYEPQTKIVNTLTGMKIEKSFISNLGGLDKDAQQESDLNRNSGNSVRD